MDVGTIEAALVVRDLATQNLKKAEAALAELNRKLGRTATDAEKTAASWDSLSKRLTKVGTEMATVGRNLTLYVTGPIAAVGGAAVKMASDFEHEITKIDTLVGINRGTLDEWSDDILKLSTEVGKSPEELAKALFVVTSAGSRGAEAMEILAEAGKASALGLGETAEIARSVTAAMQAYGKDNLDAATATRTLIATVREGNLEASELAGSLGRVIGIASQVGVSFQELGSFIATFTRLGVDSAEAVTGLRGMLSTLIKPSDGAREQLQALGTSIDEVRRKVKEQGLTQAMIDLAQATRGNVDAIGEIIPNVRALSGFLGTAGAQAEAFATIQKSITDISKDQLFTDTQLAKTKETLAHRMAELRAEVEVIAVKFGTALLPLAKGLISAFTPLVSIMSGLAKVFALLPSPVQAALVALTGFVALAGPVTWMFASISKGLGMLLARQGFQAAASGVALLVKELTLLMGLNVGSTLSSLAMATSSASAAAASGATVWGRVGMALGGLLAPLVNLVTKFPLLNSAAGAAMSAFGLLAKALGFLLTPWGLLAAGVSAVGAAFVYVTDLGGPLKNLFGSLGDLASELAGLFGDIVRFIKTDLVKACAEAAKSVASILPQSVLDGWALFKQNAKLAVDEARQGVEKLTGAIKDWREAVSQPLELEAVAGTGTKKEWWRGDTRTYLEKLRAGGGGPSALMETTDALALLNKELGGHVVKTKAARQALAQYTYEVELYGLPALKQFYLDGKAAGMSIEEMAESSAGEKMDVAIETLRILEGNMKKSAEAAAAATKAAADQEKAVAAMAGWWADVNNELVKTSKAQTAETISRLTDRMYALTEPIRQVVDLMGQLREKTTTTRVDVALGSGGTQVLGWMRQFDEATKKFEQMGALGKAAMADLRETAGADLLRLARDVDFAAMGFESMAELIAYIGSMSGIDYSKFLPTNEQWGKLLPSKTINFDPSGFIGQGLERAAAAGGWTKKLVGAFGSPAEIGAGLSQTIMSSFTGGGDLGKSIGGFFGGGLGSSLSTALGGAMSKAAEAGTGFLSGGLGKLLGGTLGSLLPGVGNLLGSLAGGLFGKLFGGDAKKTKQMREDFLATAGGLDKVREMATYAGVSIDKLLSTKKSKTFEAEVKKLEKAFAAAQERVKGLLTDLGKVQQEGTIVSRDLWDRIAKDKDKAEVKDAFAAFFKGQVDKVAQGFNTVAAGMLRVVSGLPTDEWKQLSEAIAEAAKNGERAEVSQEWLDKMPEALQRIGVLAEASFGSLLAAGKSLPEALAAIAPGLDQVQQLLTASGQSADGMLASLLGWRDVVARNEDLFTMLAGLDEMLVGLSNTGMITQESFGALAATMTDAFTTLQADGVAGADALRMMAPQLQKLWEIQRLWGYEIDETTAAMLQQAEEQGIVGEKMKSVNDKILDVLLAIGEALGAKIPEGLKAMGDAAAEAGRRVSDELGKIKPPVLKGRVMWDVEQPEMPDVGALRISGSYATGTGGLRDFGSGSLAMLHGREAVVPEAEYRTLLAGAGGNDVTVDLWPLVDEVGALRREQAEAQATLPRTLARAVRDALLTTGKW